MSVRQEIERLIGEINRAWLQGRPEDLAELFHEDMIIVKPEFAGRVEGRAACVASYRHFLDSTAVSHFEAGEVAVDSWGETAVASYRFEIAYIKAGPLHREAARDLFVFARREGRWWAVWRTVVPLPAPDE